MRTTLNLSDDLLAQAKRLAAESHRTLRAIVEDSLRESLSRRLRTGQQPMPVKLKTFGASGLLPGVDLDDSASLLDIMELSVDSD